MDGADSLPRTVGRGSQRQNQNLQGVTPLHRHLSLTATVRPPWVFLACDRLGYEVEQRSRLPGALARVVHAAVGDLALGQVNADEAAVVQALSHGDEVAAAGAAEFQDAAALDRWRMEAEQRSNGSEPVGGRLRVGVADVGNFILAGRVLFGHDRCPLAASLRRARSPRSPEARG